MRRISFPVVSLLLVFALVMSVAWMSAGTTFEFPPAISSLLLIAALTTLCMDRFVGQREERHRLLRALAREIYENLCVLKDVENLAANVDTKVMMLPRLRNSTLATVIDSGAFDTPADARLWKLLHNWQHRCNEGNCRLAVTETCVLQNGGSVAALEDRMSSRSGMRDTKKACVELAKHIVENYAKESQLEGGADMIESLGTPQDAAA